MLHEEVEVKTVQRKVVVASRLTCDFCHAEIKEGGYETREGVIRLRLGESYPDCGNTEEVRADVCEACFNSRVLPWLESQGVAVSRVKSEW